MSFTVHILPRAEKQLASLGDYRIVYEIDDVSRIVTILRIGHRKEIYR